MPGGQTGNGTRKTVMCRHPWSFFRAEPRFSLAPFHRVQNFQASNSLPLMTQPNPTLQPKS